MRDSESATTTNNEQRNLIDCWAFAPAGDISKVNAEFIESREAVESFLELKFSDGYHFGADNLTGSGIYKEGGIAFDFRPFLQEFFVEECGHIARYFAPDVASLKRALSLPGDARFYRVEPI